MSNLTPKEKAKELVDKYFAINDLKIGNQATNPFISLDYAKQCALIVVEEILKSLKTTLAHLELKPLDANEYLKDIGYWQEVRTEIDKL